MEKKFSFRKLLPVYLTVAALLFAALSCNSPKKEEQPPFDLAAAKIAIEARNKVFTDAINNGDSIAAANCYTTDAKMMQPHGKAVSGRAAIQKAISGYIKAGFDNFSMKTVAVWGDETGLTVEEEWFFNDKDGKEIDRGKSLELWKMEDGEWRIQN